MNVYIEYGYESRKDYLNCMADEFGLEVSLVYSIASMLGKDEDFDGLINACEDAVNGGYGVE